MSLISAAFSSSLAAEPQKSPDVIIHGAFGGGWDWKNVGQLLQNRGHIVYRPTLTGLGERSHLASPEISLRTHIQDVVNVTFRNPISKKLPATFVFFLDQDQDPEVVIPGNDDSKFRHGVWRRLTARGWKIDKFKGDHVSERTHPTELAAFLDALLGQP